MSDRSTAATNIAAELLRRGWNVMDYRPYRSAGLGEDYGTGPSWGGVATHDDYPDVVLCVDVSMHTAEQSGKSFTKIRWESSEFRCTYCTAGCGTCDFTSYKQRMVEEPWYTLPKDIQPTKGFYHLQYKDRIHAQGRNYSSMAQYTYGQTNTHVITFCNDIEGLAKRLTGSHVVNTTSGLQIIAEYTRKDGKPNEWTWLAFTPRMDRALWGLFWPVFKAKFGAEYSKVRHQAYITRRVEQDELDAFAHEWNKGSVQEQPVIPASPNIIIAHVSREGTKVIQPDYAAIETPIAEAIEIEEGLVAQFDEKLPSLALMYGSSILGRVQHDELPPGVATSVEEPAKPILPPAEKKYLTDTEELF